MINNVTHGVNIYMPGIGPVNRADQYDGNQTIHEPTCRPIWTNPEYMVGPPQRGTTMNDDTTTTKPCVTCNGRGWVTRTFMTHGFRMLDFGQRKCPACNGTGWAMTKRNLRHHMLSQTELRRAIIK